MTQQPLCPHCRETVLTALNKVVTFTAEETQGSDCPWVCLDEVKLAIEALPLAAPPAVPQEPRRMVCSNLKPGEQTCQLHNLHCGYPACMIDAEPNDTRLGVQVWPSPAVGPFTRQEPNRGEILKWWREEMNEEDPDAHIIAFADRVIDETRKSENPS